MSVEPPSGALRAARAERSEARRRAEDELRSASAVFEAAEVRVERCALELDRAVRSRDASRGSEAGRVLDPRRLALHEAGLQADEEAARGRLHRAEAEQAAALRAVDAARAQLAARRADERAVERAIDRSATEAAQRARRRAEDDEGDHGR